MSKISDEVLRKEIKAIIAGGDLKTLTSRKARQELEQKLGIDLSEYRNKIDSIVMSEVEDQTASHSEEEISDEEVPKGKKGSDSEDGDDDYKPGTKGKAKGRGAKKRKQDDDEDEESEEEWAKPKKGKKGPAAAKSGGGGGRGRSSAFTKSFKLSPELADVVGADVMARHEVVKRVWAVIKERKLQDPANRQFAICDDQLKKVFGVERFRTFGMMKHLKEHFLEAI